MLTNCQQLRKFSKIINDTYRDDDNDDNDDVCSISIIYNKITYNLIKFLKKL